MPPPHDENVSTLEEARQRLYAPQAPAPVERAPLANASRQAPQAWHEQSLAAIPRLERHHVRLATYFLGGAIAFFIVSAALAGYFLYYGGNSVSVKNIDLELQGPSTIAGGDTVPLSIVITNRNPVEIHDATLEIDFPEGTRDAENVLVPLTAYNENLGIIKSGQTVTRSVKAVVFGAAGQTLTLPVSLSYDTQGSNATFVKKTTYPLSISSTPLSISVDTIVETVAGKAFTLMVQVRNNATVPIDNVVVAGTFPFGFTRTSSSLPATGSSFLIGTLAPGAGRTITLSGVLDGQTSEDRVFHFAIGTAKDANAAELAVSYMVQDATIGITAPFISTSLALNGSPLASATLAPSQQQNVTVSYMNTLPTNVNDATIAVALSGGAVDYTSIRTTNGYYRSSDHTILFSKDSDPALRSLAPGNSGIGSFGFSTVSAAAFGRSPSVTFTTSVSGTRVGQSNVPQQVSASATQTVKAATAVVLSASSLHASGPFTNGGPIPPKADSTTSYTISWQVTNGASAVAEAVVSATLPSYVTYTGATSGQGSLSYDSHSRTVTWSAGDLPPSASAKAAFQVALLPSSSQRGTSPPLTSPTSFSGHDRFAGVAVTASASPVTTETVGDPGYVAAKSTVQ